MSTLPASPTATYRQKLSEADTYRLLWRAGFGPKPGEVEQVQKLGLDAAVASLTRPQGPMRLIGKPPHNDQGKPLDPVNTWGDDHCWWLDRMVRTNQPLIERMTLIWHSWFATSETASSARLILGQYRTLRKHALGNFHQLLLDVTVDPAMLIWLNGGDNNKYSPNENYGREMLELFTLGADRGYDQEDVHQNARALTGWTYDWSDALGQINFRFDPTLHDDGVKRIFGHSGRFNWRDSCRLAVTHRNHPSFFVNKLWNYFVGAELPAETGRQLERAYVRGGFAVRPIVEAILRHPLFYEGPRQVIPPAVWCAGMLRASRQTIVTNDWAWIGDVTGQHLFQPPNVAGWNYKLWLDTARWAGRLNAADLAIDNRALGGSSTYPDMHEDASKALAKALDYWGGRPLSKVTSERLLMYGRQIAHGQTASWEQVAYRQQRQNGLRLLIVTSPDWMTA